MVHNALCFSCFEIHQQHSLIEGPTCIKKWPAQNIPGEVSMHYFLCFTLDDIKPHGHFVST